MCGPHETPEPTLDAGLEARIRAAAGASSRARDAAFALAGECPTPEDVARLQEGRVRDSRRRRALARHLVACPRCADRSLAALLARDVAPGAPVRTVTPPAARPLLRVAALRHWAAAAAVLLAALVGLRSDGRGASPLEGAWLVDPYGQELRGLPVEPVARRVLVHAVDDGWLALVRRGRDGVRVEAVDGPARTARVSAGEEVVLPLDGALEVAAAEDWLVLHLSAPVEGEALESLALRAVRGGRPAGVEVLRFPVAPTRDG